LEVPLAKWFGREKQKLTVDELVVLERWDEAESQLVQRLRLEPSDLRSKVLLADVLVELKRGADAVAQYLGAAELYMRDGFFDKATALLHRASKLDPVSEDIKRRMTSVERARQRDRIRKLAAEVAKGDARERGGATASVLELQQVWDKLADTPFVRGVGPEQIRKLMAYTELEIYPPEAVLVGEGTNERVLFIIGSGAVEATVKDADGSTSLGEFGPGDVFGEAALFEQTPWSYSLVASQRTQALRLDREGFESCLSGNPDPRGFLTVLRRQGNDKALASRNSKAS
jgi:hypothetical protein